MKKNDVRKKIENYRKNKGKFNYIESRRRKKIKKDYFVLESTHGASVGGHIFYLIEEIQREVPNSKIFIVSKNPEKHKNFLESKGFKNFTIIKHLSVEYYHLLAISEYLINDTTFYPFFSKRKGQKYYIIWHGTPLKNMGKDMKDLLSVSNVQRNFYMADKIIVSNEYTKEILINSHNLKNVYKGKMVVGPSPRNSVFYNELIRKEIREKLNLSDKKIVAYMPTWRGRVGKVEKSTNVEQMLKYLDKYLDENTILYVKLHDFERNTIKAEFDNIHFFPEEYETYEFLTATDLLITDYSSVMYDYLNLNKPVVLYAYDKEDYIENRGMYENIESYPFELASNLEELEHAINSSGNDFNYKDLNNKFISSDCKLGANKVIKNIIDNYIDDSIIEHNVHNGKETVAILSGGFWNNGVTTALINTLENIDTTKRNYICFFEKSKIKPEHYYRLLNLPENVLFYPTTGEVNGNVSDRLLLKKYLWDENYTGKSRRKQLRKIYREEFDRLFGDLQIDWFIHYTGFERKEAEMMRHIDSKKAIWVHTDMFEEFKAKNNFSRKIVFGAYKDVNKIVTVHENLNENLKENINGISNKIITVNNFLGENRTNELSKSGLFHTLEGVKVDYSFNDNAYKTENQFYLEQFKSEIEEIFASVNGEKHIDYKSILEQIYEVSCKYKESEYLDYLISKELKMLDDIVRELKNIFENNDDLIYQLAFKEFKNYIIPRLKNNEDELHFYFPKLKERLEDYKIRHFNEFDDDITPQNNKFNQNYISEKYLKENEKIIKEKYQTLKREKDLSDKFESLFVSHRDEVLSYINQEVLISDNKISQHPTFDFYNHFRISKVKLLNAIFDENIKVYINIGRYDYQKGHDKLIDAFEKTFKKNHNIFLILVCPHGPLKSKTINRVRNSIARENIVILGGMNNPYPLLAYCDAFVLSSNYEGLGLVVYEALAVNTDVITVNLPETIQYLNNNEAIIVDNSASGLIEGFKLHLNEIAKLNKFDFIPMREKSIKEFERVFE